MLRELARYTVGHTLAEAADVAIGIAEAAATLIVAETVKPIGCTRGLAGSKVGVAKSVAALGGGTAQNTVGFAGCSTANAIFTNQ